MATKRKHIEQPTEQNALDFMYQVQVTGHLDLGNEWKGWKLRGPYLVAPNGDRILPQRLLGLLYVEKLQKRVMVASRKSAAAAAPSPLADLGVIALPRRRVA